ncbi:hypothetical protein CCACVL1_29212 [Corchorus capsularis]|uniref:Uncharacterized protein n=1 Tax=Corchorus capsularis TaxID=210143 RepID=A0A1R3G368_COCAP|nr:hypothetical protein CCACVL1_29212 [Corchorus capsularis]
MADARLVSSGPKGRGLHHPSKGIGNVIFVDQERVPSVPGSQKFRNLV